MREESKRDMGRMGFQTDIHTDRQIVLLSDERPLNVFLIRVPHMLTQIVNKMTVLSVGSQIQLTGVTAYAKSVCFFG